MSNSATSDFFALIEQFAEQVDAWVVDRSREALEVLDVWADLSTEIAIQVKTGFETEIEPFLHDFFNADFNVSWEWDGPIAPPIHPVCQGCQHYHGQQYGENFLVCGMHPYGLTAQTTTCADRDPV